MFHMSRLTVNEKQHLISGSFEFGSGFFREQLVRIAFWVWSNAIAPNFSQYDTRDGSAMISCKAMLPCRMLEEFVAREKESPYIS